MFADRIVKFGARFEGRLNADLLKGALDYVAYSEEGLAFEILCDYICEYDVSITDEEYSEAVKLAQDLGLNMGEGAFKSLLGLKG